MQIHADLDPHSPDPQAELPTRRVSRMLARGAADRSDSVKELKLLNVYKNRACWLVRVAGAGAGRSRGF